MEADLASNLPPAADGKGKEEVVHDPTFERGEFRHLERAHSRPAMIRGLHLSESLATNKNRSIHY